jgi:hypothetical protein
MTTSEKNQNIALNLAAALSEKVENIRFDVLAETSAGAALYRVDNGMGDIHHVIEGETGEMLILGEGIEDSEAIEQFNQ